MIAANVVADDPDHGCNADRKMVKIFEEYANGGLEYLQEPINIRHQPVDLVVLDLVTEAFAGEGGASCVSVDELLRGVNW